MSYLGLLMLGVFVGTMLCVAVRKTTNWSDAVKVVVALIGAALSGVSLLFIDKLPSVAVGHAVFMYPVGLAWSLLWLYADQAIDNVKSTDINQKIVGHLHLAGMIIGTALVALLLFSESFRKLLPS